jgi:hypothetical protein
MSLLMIHLRLMKMLLFEMTIPIGSVLYLATAMTVRCCKYDIVRVKFQDLSVYNGNGTINGLK